MMRYFIRVENNRLVGYVKDECEPKDKRYMEYTESEYIDTLKRLGVLIENEPIAKQTEPTTEELINILLGIEVEHE